VTLAGVPAVTLAALVVVSLVAGVGITAVGPGGVFLTIALYALTDLPPGVVVGTASATFVATGLLGTASYYRSGQLGATGGARTATVLSATGIAGTLVGVRLNAIVDAATFGVLLGGFVGLTGLLVLYRTRHGTGGGGCDPRTRRGSLLIGAIGGFVGVSGGLLGIGGPVLGVPILVATGLPMLLALAAAQVQSVFIAGFATVGYAARGAVAWPLVLALGVPELVGILVGWKAARVVDADRLKLVMAGLMLLIGPCLTLTHVPVDLDIGLVRWLLAG
jgi:uncharacterized membrane protein YfcA